VKIRIILLTLLFVFALVAFTSCNANDDINDYDIYDPIQIAQQEKESLMEYIQTVTAMYTSLLRPPPMPIPEPELEEFEEIPEPPAPEAEYEPEEEPKEDKLEEEPEEIAPLPYRIALTFDDGPSRYTPYILDILEEHGARATFFVLGRNVERNADTVRRAVALGSEVAGHSWNHPSNWGYMNEDTIRQQIQDTSNTLEYVLGQPSPLIFRPPFGIVNSRVRTVARERGYVLVNWSVDTKDWRDRDACIVYERVMYHAADGAIVLMHDIRETTMEAMERIVPSLIERGFELVTVSELLDYFWGDELDAGGLYNGLRR